MLSNYCGNIAHNVYHKSYNNKYLIFQSLREYMSNSSKQSLEKPLFHLVTFMSFKTIATSRTASRLRECPLSKSMSNKPWLAQNCSHSFP